MRVPPDPVPSPRPGGDDDEAGQIPRPRTVADANASAVEADGTSNPETRTIEPSGDDAPSTGPDDEAEPVAPPRADQLPAQRGVGTSSATSEPSPASPPSDDPAPSTPPDPAVGSPDAVATPRPAPDDELDPAGAVLGEPRPAPDDDLARRAAATPAPKQAPATRVYADGSALAQFVDGSSCHDEWLEWTTDHEAELLTTPLGLTELRRFALPAGVEARGVARDVEQRITVVRFSDQTLRAATKVSGVLPPFTALHIGAALAHSDVVAVATYEIQLARVAALHGLMVVAPGMAPFWWEQDD